MRKLLPACAEGGQGPIAGGRCDGCGGSSTPGGAATVQQSLGAVVRAVPGVERALVTFDSGLADITPIDEE